MRVPTAGLLAVLFGIIAAAAPAAAQMRGYPPYYPPYGYAQPDANVRVDVKPRNARVYVDGFYAGEVDDFDGVFQRLHVAPGNHEIVIYLHGFHSLHEQLYVGPNATRKISAKLQPLSPGEPDDPVPVPAAVVPGSEGGPASMPPPQRGPRRFPTPPPPNGPEARRPPMPPDTQPSANVGTVVIRVQPGGSDILIDGEHWEAPADAEGSLIVQLSEGHHVIEVHKSGYRDLRTDIDVRAGVETPINVSLAPDR